MSSFKDKLVFITGGASGIGKATAESFATDGAMVCIGDIGDGTEVAKAIGGAYYKLDVTDEDNTRTVAIEQGGRGIRANTVCPASIAGTGMMIDEDESPEAKFFGGITALGRMGRPADVVNMAKFLASDEANFITGGEFTVDGGLTAGLSNSLAGALWGE